MQDLPIGSMKDSETPIHDDIIRYDGWMWAVFDWKENKSSSKKSYKLQKKHAYKTI